MSSPMVAIETLMLLAMIDAKERRYMVTADVPRTFMQADMDEVVYMKLTGPLVELLTKVDEEK